MSNHSKCRACPHLVMFAKQEPNEKNPDPKSNPLDVSPSANGNLRLNFGSMRYEVLTGEKLEEARANGEKLYLSHFVTCPARKQFRKK